MIQFRKSIEIIERQNSSEPLFLYISYQAAHTPIVRPPRRFLNQYPRLRSRYNKRGFEAHVHRAATITVSITYQ